MNYMLRYASPLGGITMTGEGDALTGLWFDGQKYSNNILVSDRVEKHLPVFNKTIKWLDIYFSGGIPDFTPAISIESTAFRKAVWNILLTIPYGSTMTYGEIAKKIALRQGMKRMSAQAVGGAVGHNPIVLIIPCHRVIGKNGSLTGYAAELEKKEALLRLERVL